MSRRISLTKMRIIRRSETVWPAMIVDSVLPFGRIAFTDAALVKDTVKEAGKDIKNIVEGTASKTVQQRTFRRLAWFSALFGLALASAIDDQDDPIAQDRSARDASRDMFTFGWTDENGVRHDLRFPNTFGPGALINGMANGIVALLQSDEGKKDKYMQRVGWTLFEGFIPGLQNIMPYELIKDLFTDAPMQQDNKGLAKPLQKGKSETGTEIARALNMSPDRLEAIMEDVFPGMAALFLASMDKWAVGKPNRPIGEAFFGRLRTLPNYTAGTEAFYKAENGGSSLLQVDEAHWQQYKSENDAGVFTNIEDIKKNDPERYVAIAFAAEENNDSS